MSTTSLRTIFAVIVLITLIIAAIGVACSIHKKNEAGKVKKSESLLEKIGGFYELLAQNCYVTSFGSNPEQGNLNGFLPG
ncbi:MAG: hypothetical protein JW738_04430 [Actinobacteria bacterium]|nr:hypothetical protein [Actinomycetota bacterium]